MKSNSIEAITTATTAEAVFFPLDRELGVKGRNWSESIIREAASATTRWLNQAGTKLFQGQAETIADAISDNITATSALANDDLVAAVTYFQNNHKRMQYMEFLEDSFPIGSAIVESAAKQFKARFTGPGMRWSRQGLLRLIPIRSAIFSDTFDDLWDSVFISPLNSNAPAIKMPVPFGIGICSYLVRG